MKTQGKFEFSRPCGSAKRLARRVGLSLVLLALILVSLVMVGCGGEIEKKQALELRKMAAETPLYPGFQKTGEKVVLKQGMVYFFTYYSAKVAFADVKAFYDRALERQGWGPPQQSGPSLFRSGNANWVMYRKGDYVVSVTQHQDSNEGFSVVYEWNPQ